MPLTKKAAETKPIHTILSHCTYHRNTETETTHVNSNRNLKKHQKTYQRPRCLSEVCSPLCGGVGAHTIMYHAPPRTPNINVESHSKGGCVGCEIIVYLCMSEPSMRAPTLRSGWRGHNINLLGVAGAERKLTFSNFQMCDYFASTGVSIEEHHHQHDHHQMMIGGG